MIQVQLPAPSGAIDLNVREFGSGEERMLILHGGAGPASVYAFAEKLADSRSAHVIVPTHPGFEGTPRPEALRSVASLAGLYAELLRDRALTNVTIIGNSIGGWIAAELALMQPERVGAAVLVGAVGIHVEGHPVPDFFAMNFGEVMQRSYYDPQRFAIDPATLPPERLAAIQANRTALAVYAQTTMEDPTLRTRLTSMRVPTLVLYGEADRIVDPEYARAFGAAISGATFQLLPRTGHLPQLETPDELLRVIGDFVRGSAIAPVTR
jgi:pimeloyl-ACP methyl ester carboxylesterase